MKVDKETFLFCLEYLERVNRRDLNHLDLSDFFDKDFKFIRVEDYFTPETVICGVEQAMKHWKSTGRNNQDFILDYYKKVGE